MINFDLKSRVAVVTGGAQGFGFAITKKRFLSSGAKVIIWDIDKNETEKSLKELNSKNCTSQIVDVTDFNSINKNLEEIVKQHGKVDIFINNAGMTGMNAKVWEYPTDEWNKVINLDLNAIFIVVKQLCRT